MNEQFFKRALVVVLFLGLTGCATYPPPVIRGDTATNFKYQYSVGIPKGWDAYTTLPQDLKSQLSQVGTDKLSLAMVNKESKGMILFINDKNFPHFDNVLERPDDDWKEVADSFKANLEKEAQVTRSKSDLKIENLAATYENYKATPESFKSMPWYEIEADLSYTMANSTIGYVWFLYPCHKRNFCQNMVVSISEADKYDANRPALNAVLESLTMHDMGDN